MKGIESLTLELTNRCDLRCRMCDIWKEKKKKFLSPADVKRALALSEGPVWVALTGGEPFLHPEFDEIYRLLCLSYFKKKVRSIDISTNGAGGKIAKFLERNRKLLFPLSVSVSLDGLKKTHELQRGVGGSFERTLDNIRRIRLLLIPVSIKFTATPLNYREALKVYLLSRKLGAEFLIKPAEINPRYYNRLDKTRTCSIPRLRPAPAERLQKDLLEILSLEKKDKRTSNPLACFAIENMLKFLRSGNLDFIKRCRVAEKCLFITSEGNIHSCIYYAAIGNIKDSPLRLFENKALVAKAAGGECHKCLAFHGYLSELNMRG